jgi:tetratricopeptide (TPR) repeat protein
LICTFLCAPFLIKAQNISEAFVKADSLYEAGSLQEARLMYERIIFMLNQSSLPPDSLQELKNEALLKKTFCYKAHSNFAEAQKTIERADVTNLSDSLNFLIRYETSLCTYLAEHYNEAYNYILQLKYFVKDTTLTNQVDFLEILTLNELKRWQEAKKLCAAYIQKNNLKANVEELYAFLQNPKIRNPEKAVILSTFLPGVGQMYAGYPFRGIVSAALQLACFSFGAYSIWQGYYLSGFFTGFVLLQAFYSGGIRHTRYLVEKRNKERITSYNESVKNFLLKAESEKADN